MIINCRINDNIKHEVIWKSRVSMFGPLKEKSKIFPNFMSASGFVDSLNKKKDRYDNRIEVLAIIPLNK